MQKDYANQQKYLNLCSHGHLQHNCPLYGCEHNSDILQDIEVEGKTGGFKGDWVVGLCLMAIIVLVIVS